MTVFKRFNLRGATAAGTLLVAVLGGAAGAAVAMGGHTAPAPAAPVTVHQAAEDVTAAPTAAATPAATVEPMPNTPAVDPVPVPVPKAETAKESADRSKTEADRSRTEADRSTTEADRSATHAERAKAEADRAAAERAKAEDAAAAAQAAPAPAPAPAPPVHDSVGGSASAPRGSSMPGMPGYVAPSPTPAP